MAFDFFRNQLATVIEWRNPAPAALLWKFPSATDEIKNASELLVGPGQGVLLVYEGQVRDVLEAAGRYPLATDNHPFLTTLTRLRTAFESAHKLKLYFYRQAENVNQPWGTSAPVTYLDPEYQIPVTLGAHGNFSFRVADARRFFTEVAGLADEYAVPQARVLLQSRIGQELATQLAAARLSYQEVAAQLAPLAARLREPLAAEFARLGLELTDFQLSGTQFDAATQQRIGRIADATADRQAAAATGQSYAEVEKLRALREAARAEGGLAGTGVQLAAAASLGSLFVPQAPPPGAGPDPVLQLHKVKQLLDKGIITPEEFEARKKPLLDSL